MSETQQKTQGVQQLLVDQSHEGQRIDNFLLTLLKGVPRSYIYRILRRGEVRVNKGRVKAGYRLRPGDLLRIPPLKLPQKEDRPGPDRGLVGRIEEALLFQEKRFLVLNKPSGIAVHGGSGLNHGVIEALRQMRPEEQQLELVHRLDRDTSGCLLISRKRSALRMLHQLIRDNRVDKRYLALVAGRWARGSGR